MKQHSNYFDIATFGIPTLLTLTLSVTGCLKQSESDSNAHSQYSTQTSSDTNSPTNKPNSGNYQPRKNQNCNNQAIANAYQAKNLNHKVQVLGCGQVIKVLKDDNDGSRHQKFLVKIQDYPQITVLIAHNIDLAQRINSLKANTPIRFYGEYIYNDKGGVIHWTHKDPASRHQDGWLEYQGKKYW